MVVIGEGMEKKFLVYLIDLISKNTNSNVLIFLLISLFLVWLTFNGFEENPNRSTLNGETGFLGAVVAF